VADVPERLAIGFDRALITPGPQHWPIWLSGYGDRTEPATGVHDDLEVRVLVAADGDTLVALVALDLMAMSADWALALRSGVADELDVAPDHVLTHTVHTHAAPSTISGTEALGWPVPRGWRDDLLAACRAAARRARAAARPARLRYARLGLPPALSFNRRGYSTPQAYAVLDVLDADGGGRIGTIANVGVHPVVLGPRNRRVSADWVGACRAEVERRLGGTTMFLQGCQGDIDPAGMAWDAGDAAAIAAVRRVGEDFALAVVAAAAVATGAGTGERVRTATRVLDLDVAGSPMAAITRRSSLAVELHEWSIGGVHLVTIPGEGFAELGARIVAGRAGEPVLLAGFAPHWLGYLPVPFAEGYEEGLSYGEHAVGEIVRALELPLAP
jgi:hypothetical protein